MFSASRRFATTLFLLLLLGVFTALPAVVGPQKAKPRFLAKKDGPHGTVILLNNCDASAMAPGDNPLTHHPDNEDCKINGPADQQQLEPIKICRSDTRGPVSLKLVNDDPDASEDVLKKVRIFNAQGRAILGAKTKDKSCTDQGTSAQYPLSQEELKQLAQADLTFYAEGLQFAVSAHLQLFVGDEKADELALYVAPFLLLPQTRDPLTNMVVRLNWHKPSGEYVEDFQRKCDQARQLDERAKKMALRIFSVDHDDRWMEDELSWGCTETPRCRLPVVLHMHRLRSLQTQVRSLLGQRVGYFQAFNYAPLRPNSLDSGGNLEVSPATEKYPFGRVYYGSLPGEYTKDDPDPYRMIDLGYQRFFKRQKRHPSDKTALQEPINLWTSWLTVGHVDEIVSFVPAKNKRGFVLLWASPSLGLELLKNLSPHEQEKVDSLDRRYLTSYGDPQAKSFTVKDLLVSGPAQPVGGISKSKATFLQMDLITYNEKVDARVRKNVSILKEALELADDEIVALPALFCNDANPRVQGQWSADGLSPTPVNLSSMGLVSLIPDPFIPVFKKEIIKRFQDIGQTPLFIDSWNLYHLQKGGVHCGSNMHRESFHGKKWWD